MCNNKKMKFKKSQIERYLNTNQNKNSELSQSTLIDSNNSGNVSKIVQIKLKNKISSKSSHNFNKTYANEFNTSRSMITNSNDCNSNVTTVRNTNRKILGQLDTNSTKFLNN